MTYTIRIISERGVEEKTIYQETFGLPGTLKFREVSTDIDIRECPESANLAGVQSLCKAVLDWQGTLPGLRHDAGNSWLKYADLLDMAAQAARAKAR